MIVPKGKKGLSCSMGQLKLLLLGDMIVPVGNANVPGGEVHAHSLVCMSTTLGISGL